MSLMISLKSMKIASGQASGGSATGLCQSTWSQGGGESFVFPSARGDCCSTFKLQALSFNVSTFQRFNVQTFEFDLDSLTTPSDYIPSIYSSCFCHRKPNASTIGDERRSCNVLENFSSLWRERCPTRISRANLASSMHNIPCDPLTYCHL